jgi:hypothetical protein
MLLQSVATALPLFSLGIAWRLPGLHTEQYIRGYEM